MMDKPISAVDPDGLREFSVVFTDRSLNHMSKTFQEVMRDLSGLLREVYGAEAAVIVPGGGTYAMEAVARQFATDARVMVIRNGWFSYRWTQIFEAGRIPAAETVLKARRVEEAREAPFAPVPVGEVVAAIAAERPAVVFAPHVETSAGIMLPDGYIRAVAEAVHAVGGLFVLDCVASGAMWVDMAALGRRRADQRAAEGMERLAVERAGDAESGGRGAAGRDDEHEFRLRSGQVAFDHAGVSGRRARLSRDDADRRAEGVPRAGA